MTASPHMHRPLPATADDHGDLLALARAWRRAGKQVALATLLRTWGSAPNPPGSHLIIDDQGTFEGSVSGGCVENELVGKAQDVIATGTPVRLTYGIADEDAWSVGLPCGGTLEVLLERLD